MNLENLRLGDLAWFIDGISKAFINENIPQLEVKTSVAALCEEIVGELKKELKLERYISKGEVKSYEIIWIEN